MQFILVAGAASGVGKTTLTAQLLTQLPGWGAIKLTVTKEEEVCQVISDPKIINQEGKDTALFRQMGAARVIWLKASSSLVGEALRRALPVLTDLPGVILEGNSLLEHLKPQAVIFVTDGIKEMKPSGQRALKQADFIVVNNVEKTFRHKEKFQAPFFFLNLKNRNQQEWLKFWQEIKRKLGGEEKLNLEEKIKEKILEALDEDGKLSCGKAHEIADSLGVERKVVGDVLNKMKIKLHKCQLGCF